MSGFRLYHQFRAWLGGYFWLPCPLCGRFFGGHEVIDDCFIDVETIEHGAGSYIRGIAVCPRCLPTVRKIERNRRVINVTGLN